MKPRLHIRQALSDPHLLGRSLEGDSWLPWRVPLIAAMGTGDRALSTRQ